MLRLTSPSNHMRYFFFFSNVCCFVILNSCLLRMNVWRGFCNENRADNKESMKNGKCHWNESFAAASPCTVRTQFFGFPLWKTTDSWAIAAIPFDVKYKQVRCHLLHTATNFDYKFDVKLNHKNFSFEVKKLDIGYAFHRTSYKKKVKLTYVIYSMWRRSSEN